MNELRREAQRTGGLSQIENLLTPSEALKRREKWKYAALREILQGRPHEFEYELGGFVFDLVLFDTKTLVEFDGPNHLWAEQIEIDDQKEKVAIAAGFVVIRRSVQPTTVVDPSTLSGL